MTLVSPWAAHAVCLALFAADLGARAVRLRGYLRGLGAELSLGRAFQVNAFGDAAAGLTPMRFGGEMAKFGGLLRARIAARTAVIGLGIEAAVTYPVVALFGGWLAWRFAPAWWRSAGPALASALAAWWPWMVAVGCLTVAAGVGTWWWCSHREPGPGTPRSAVTEVRAWPAVSGALLSFVNVLARTLMLPVLAQTLPEHPPFGVMMIGSFVLLYSQLVLPMPGGLGAVDLGFLSGLAGNLGPGRGALLLAWRFYTVGAGALLGLGLAVATLGAGPLLRLLRASLHRSPRD
ncbi:MAG TPA: lysylphosphatidylglycerol synthase domain-containing protein [Gemmatimonadales bacterium]|nr:lysylphosphatidylglycerol synthase domain-containing protein [Gemmatimonadales bacterium]